MAVTTTTSLAAGLTASAASGAMAADAQYKAGRSQKRAAMTEAAMTEQAARQADMEAREQIARTRAEQRRFRGAQRAAYAAGGVVTTTGSPIDILGRTAALQELQIQDMARKASTEYTGGFARARQIRVGGKAALSGAKRASTGTLVGTAANVATGVAGGFDAGIFGAGKSLI